MADDRREHPEWDIRTAFRVVHIEERAGEWIARKSGTAADKSDVQVQIRTGRR